MPHILALLVLSFTGCKEPKDPFADQNAYYEDNRAAHAAYLSGDYRKAEEIFVRMLERFAHSYDAHVRSAKAEEVWLRGYHDLGWVRVAMGDYKKAVGNFSSAMEYINNETVFLPQTLGFACRLAGQDAEAERWFRKSLAEPATTNNRVARLSLALLYCETGRTEEQASEERSLLEEGAKELYNRGPSYWNNDQIQQEAYYRRRLKSPPSNQENLVLLYRMLLALQPSAYGLQVVERYEERLRLMAETTEMGRTLLGSDHPLVAEALCQEAKAVWQTANRFAHNVGPRRHTVRRNDSLMLREQQLALVQSHPDVDFERLTAEGEQRRSAGLDKAIALYEQASAIDGKSPRIQRELDAIRRERTPLNETR